MLYSEYSTVETAFNGVSNRNHLMGLNRFKIPDDGADHYINSFRYTKDLFEHAALHKSVKDYESPKYADYLIMDFDGSDLNEVLERVRTICERLKHYYDVNLKEIRVYFSGSKGFHVYIPSQMFGCSPESNLHSIFKQMVAEISMGIEYDPHIYGPVALIRLPNTKNSKSGLFKIPLSIDEVYSLSVEEIKELAKAPRKVDFVPTDDVTENEALKSLYEDIKSRLQEKALPLTSHSNSEFTVQKYNKPCIDKILVEGIPEGNRDNTALRIAVEYRKKGFPEAVVYGILQGWNSTLRPPLDSDSIDRITKQAYERDYDFGCNDSILKKFCDKRCQYYKGTEQQDIQIMDYRDLENKYQEYVDNLNKRKIQLGIPKIDQYLRGIAPGEVLQIIARSAVGKTAFQLNIIKNVSKSGITVLFFSMEMPGAQIFERMAQISGRAEGQQIEDSFRTKSTDVSSLRDAVKEGFKNVIVVDRDFLTIEDLIAYVKAAEAKLGKEIGLIAIDYLGRMKGPKGSEYEVVSELAKQLKHLAKETDKAVICLHQTNRAGGTGSEEVTMDMCRGSGVIEEAADQILAMWRPDIDKPEAQASTTEEVVVAILKNRKGRVGKCKMTLDKPFLQFKDIEEKSLLQTKYDKRNSSLKKLLPDGTEDERCPF